MTKLDCTRRTGPRAALVLTMMLASATAMAQSLRTDGWHEDVARLAGETGGGAQWIAGLFYSQDDFEAENFFESGDFFLTNLFWDNDQTTTTYAVFGSIEIVCS